MGGDRLEINLKQDKGGKITGKFKTFERWEGNVRGTMEGRLIDLKLDQKTKRCKGGFNLAGQVVGSRIEGTYQGLDCRGHHEEGCFLLTRAGSSGSIAQSALIPQPTVGQKTMELTPGLLALFEEREPFALRGYLWVLPVATFCQINILNKSNDPLEVNQAKIFLLDSKGLEIHRFSDYELRYNMLRTINSPNLPKYYTVTGSSTGSYSLQEIGSGFTSDFYPIKTRHDSYRNLGDALGYAIFGLMEKIGERREAQETEELIRLTEKVDPKDRILRGEQAETGGLLIFGAPATLPLRLVTFLKDQQIVFTFSLTGSGSFGN